MSKAGPCSPEFLRDQIALTLYFLYIYGEIAGLGLELDTSNTSAVGEFRVTDGAILGM